MGMPGIYISFMERAATAVTRGNRGIIAMIIRETPPKDNDKKLVEILSAADIPSMFTEGNQRQIKNALKGYTNAPKKLLVYCLEPGGTGGSGEMGEGAESMEAAEGAGTGTYADALKTLETEKFNYLVAPSCETDGQTDTIVSWVEGMRTDGKMIKAVLPNANANKEFIVNYVTRSVTDEDGKTYTAEEYCSRIAGIIAGTPLNISCTYAPLPELVDCDRMKKSEMDKMVEDGKLFVYHDGEKVKVARGVTSFTAVASTKGKQFKKIKIVDTMDMITDDIRKAIEDGYIGKYENSYDNKCILMGAIGAYFENLRKSGVLSLYRVEIDIEANRAYLKESGINTEDMDDGEVKKADTGDKVFLKASVKILDTIEEVYFPIEI